MFCCHSRIDARYINSLVVTSGFSVEKVITELVRNSYHEQQKQYKTRQITSAMPKMMRTTLCLLLREDELCLAVKKDHKNPGVVVGIGKLNGYGGKVEPGESIEDAAKREVLQEAGVKVRALEKVGTIEYLFPETPRNNQVVHIYLCDRWTGEPRETEEMHAPEWFRLNQIPYSRMWKNDQEWLPLVLKGHKVTGRVEHSETRNYDVKIRAVAKL